MPLKAAGKQPLKPSLMPVDPRGFLLNNGMSCFVFFSLEHVLPDFPLANGPAGGLAKLSGNDLESGIILIMSLGFSGDWDGAMNLHHSEENVPWSLLTNDVGWPADPFLSFIILIL